MFGGCSSGVIACLTRNGKLSVVAASAALLSRTGEGRGGEGEQIAGLINTPFQNPAKSRIMQEARWMARELEGASFLFSLSGSFLLHRFRPLSSRI